MFVMISLLSVLSLGSYGFSAQDESNADLVLTGEITYADNQTYREVPFSVPEGVTRVTVQFSYSGREQRTTIDLGLFDGERFRGWSGGNKNTFTISETDATPSYLPGAIRPGVWKLVLGIPNIRQGVRSEFQARIYFSHRRTPVPVYSFSMVPVSTENGWFRGDLHMHTGHSDGSCKSQGGREIPCPVFKTAEAAVNRGLDFIAITDHDTVSQYEPQRELQPYFDRLVLIAGREITTFQGHANVFGTMQFIDFRVGTSYVPNVNTLLEQVNELHALISLSHPRDPSGEVCMGCGWTAKDTDFSRIQAIEAINGGDSEGRFSGISFWETQLNRGFRLTAIGGSDNHHPDVVGSPSSIGHPTTVVYAKDLSETSILDGIRSGRVFIDVQGSRNRILDFFANMGTSTIQMGEQLKASNGEVIRFSAHLTAVKGSYVEVIEDGHKVALLSDPVIMQDDAAKTFDFTCDGSRHWLRVNVRTSNGSLLLLGNAVYINF
jgi:hypothetical protein